ncbi:hypothetical protein OSCI_1640002 [Kamptonema sp. PCC 6506]|nr:hypothetical protein OSCI_1640002 [Kamptonema sp. PCC 6506]
MLKGCVDVPITPNEANLYNLEQVWSKVQSTTTFGVSSINESSDRRSNGICRQPAGGTAA